MCLPLGPLTAGQVTSSPTAYKAMYLLFLVTCLVWRTHATGKGVEEDRAGLKQHIKVSQLIP